MILIGISGTNASGKDTLSKILADEGNLLFVSAGDMLRNEVKKRGLPPKRENTRDLSVSWRREFGLSIIVDKAIEIYKQHSHRYKGLVIASIRNTAEADRIHDLGGKVVWLDADPKIRYQRLQSVNSTRGRDRESDDNKTFEEFLEEENIEMHSKGDNATLNSAGVKAKSDIIIENNSNNLTGLKVKIKQILNSY